MKIDLEVCQKCQHCKNNEYIKSKTEIGITVYYCAGKFYNCMKVFYSNVRDRGYNFEYSTLYWLENNVMSMNTEFVIPETCPYILEHAIQEVTKT